MNTTTARNTTTFAGATAVIPGTGAELSEWAQQYLAAQADAPFTWEQIAPAPEKREPAFSLAPVFGFSLLLLVMFALTLQPYLPQVAAAFHTVGYYIGHAGDGITQLKAEWFHITHMGSNLSSSLNGAMDTTTAS